MEEVTPAVATTIGVSIRSRDTATEAEELRTTAIAVAARVVVAATAAAALGPAEYREEEKPFLDPVLRGNLPDPRHFGARVSGCSMKDHLLRFLYTAAAGVMPMTQGLAADHWMTTLGASASAQI